MGFYDPAKENTSGPIAVPKGLDINPRPRETSIGEEWGAAWRMESPIGSAINSFRYDPTEPIDPNYSPLDEIKGSRYEEFWDRFAGARNPADTIAMKLKIDREIEDRSTLAAAGWRGTLLTLGASLLSPSTLLPGGAVFKGANGVRIGATALSVGTSAAVAAGIDEAVLHETQQTRTPEESLLAIGGSFILGGLLGAGVGTLAKHEFRAASKQSEDALVQNYNFVEGLRSVGAAETGRDFTLKREKLFTSIRDIPIVGYLVKTSPLLRTILSDIDETRKASAKLAESPYQYKVNDEGLSVLAGDSSVETRIKEREYNDLSNAYGTLNRLYSEYWADGPVGMVGRITQPVTRAYSHLLGKTEKLTEKEFMEEIGRAMRRSDAHPIPQVEAAAKHLRESIFDKIKGEAEELGLLGKDTEVQFADSYFSRVYNVGKIARHLGDGTADDMKEMLIREFTAEREKIGEAVDVNEVTEAADGVIGSILGLKPGEANFRAAVGDPRKARVLTLRDEVLEPWLESDATAVMQHYFHSLVPELEIVRAFGDVDMTLAQKAINEESARRAAAASSEKARQSILKTAQADIDDLIAMRDRLRGIFGVPTDPDAFIVQAARTSRHLSFMGHLGQMVISAIADISGVVGRGGIQAAFGASVDLVSNPTRLFKSAAEMREFGAAAEWYLSSRAASLNDVFDPYARRTKLDRAGSMASGKFAHATGMIAWNTGWKSIASAVVATRMMKATEAVAAGRATKKQLAQLAENGVEPWMAERIAKQVEKFADKDGQIWMPKAGQWSDQEAFHAFRRAMVREQDIAIITPGQDIPLSFSKESGKFFLQFKRFGFSAYERVLLAGLQRTDADVVAQFTTAVLLGGLASNIRADIAGRERKTGAAWWEDAIDKSGVAGWLMEPYGMLGAMTAGKTTLSGQVTSRYQSRNKLSGLLGPNVDMWLGVGEAAGALSSGQASYKDIHKLMRPVPGNNLPYLLGLFRKIEDAMVSWTGAKPRTK